MIGLPISKVVDENNEKAAAAAPGKFVTDNTLGLLVAMKFYMFLKKIIQP